MTSVHFKKNPTEKANLKKVKKEHLKNLKVLNPAVTKKNSLFGFKTNEMSKISVVVNLANAAKAALAN